MYGLAPPVYCTVSVKSITRGQETVLGRLNWKGAVPEPVAPPARLA